MKKIIVANSNVSQFSKNHSSDSNNVVLKMYKVAGFLMLIGLLVLTESLAAQNASKKIIYETNGLISAKKYLPIDAVNVNTKAMRNFKKEFAVIENEKWFFLRDCYTASFVKADIKFRVDYDKKGNWIATVKTYREDKLPREIRSIIKSNYFDYAIIIITEIALPNQSAGPTYYAHIEDKKSFKNLIVTNNEITIWEEFDKD